MLHHPDPKQATESLPSAKNTHQADRWLTLIEVANLSSRMLSQAVEKATGMGSLRIRLLAILGEPQALATSQREIASRLGISPAHLSGLVEWLRTHQMAEAYRDENDRRLQRWRITSHGRTTLDRSAALLSEQLSTGLSYERELAIESLTHSLRTLNGFLGTLASNPPHTTPAEEQTTPALLSMPHTEPNHNEQLHADEKNNQSNKLPSHARSPNRLQPREEAA